MLRASADAFARLDAVVERHLELGQVHGLATRDQGRQSDDAAVADAEPGVPPQVGERTLRSRLM